MPLRWPDTSRRSGDPRLEHLREVVSNTKLIGGAFALVGLFFGMVAAYGGGRPSPVVFAAVASTLMSSGVMYVVFGYFLARRRYWAWMATCVMTILVAVFVLSLCVYVAVELIRAGDQIVAGPLVALGCWAAALALIFKSLRVALPAVRESEAVAQMGFAVIPVAQVAEGGGGEETSRDAARERAG